MMYRAVTWLALQRGLDTNDEKVLVELANEARFELGQPTADGAATIRVDGKDVTRELRSADVDRNVSLISRIPGVREAMVRRQRELAGEGRLIMLGRDIGSVVLPDAPAKIYLDASAEERARRRHQELVATGVIRPAEEILQELLQRDGMDQNRHVSPLRPAPGAIVIDTDGLSLDEVVERAREAATLVA
jgi:cytidylate kinase